MKITDVNFDVSVYSDDYYSTDHLSNGNNNNDDRRGWVYYKNELFFKEFSHCRTLHSIDELKTLIKDDVYYHPALEGSIIRVFFLDGRWYTTTTSKLNAFKTRWGRLEKDPLIECINKVLHVVDEYVEPEVKSYGKRFEECMLKSFPNVRNLEEVYELKFDKNKKYVFMLLSNWEDRHVCRYDDDESKVKLLGVFDENNNVELNVNIEGIETLEYKVLNDDDHLKEAKDTFQNKLCPEKHQGYNLFDSKDRKCYKLYLEEYDKLRNMRDGQPNLLMRYIQIKDICPSKLFDFYTLFPEMKLKVKIFEEGCKVLYRRLHRFVMSTKKKDGCSYPFDVPPFTTVKQIILMEHHTDDVKITPSKIETILKRKHHLLHRLMFTYFVKFRNFDKDYR